MEGREGRCVADSVDCWFQFFKSLDDDGRSPAGRSAAAAGESPASRAAGPRSRLPVVVAQVYCHLPGALRSVIVEVPTEATVVCWAGF